MPRILLPPSCAGFADGNTKYLAEGGPGSFVNIDDTDPVGQRALKKLKAQDYASAGLVTGEEKFFVRGGPEGKMVPVVRREHDLAFVDTKLPGVRR